MNQVLAVERIAARRIVKRSRRLAAWRARRGITKYIRRFNAVAVGPVEIEYALDVPTNVTKVLAIVRVVRP
jgi:hypothetical protein